MEVKKVSYKQISIDVTNGGKYIDVTQLNRRSIILTEVLSIKCIPLT